MFELQLRICLANGGIFKLLLFAGRKFDLTGDISESLSVCKSVTCVVVGISYLWKMLIRR